MTWQYATDERLAEQTIYLISTNTHCKTPAVPVHTEGPVLTIESWINKPTDAAKETKETTYAKKSQSFNLQLREALANTEPKSQVENSNNFI